MGFRDSDRHVSTIPSAPGSLSMLPMLVLEPLDPVRGSL